MEKTNIEGVLQQLGPQNRQEMTPTMSWFLDMLTNVGLTSHWQSEIRTRGPNPDPTRRGEIRLRRAGSEKLYCPCTAVYFFLTCKEIESSFLMPEITDTFRIPELEVVQIAHASDA